MSEVGYATLAIIPSFKNFGRNLNTGTSGSLTAAGRDGGRRFSSAFSAAAKVGVIGGALAAAGAVKFGRDSIAEAREAQKVGALTRQVIKTTGGAAKVTEKQVGRLATRISNKTAIDDEAIQSGANLLLTFKNVRNEAGKGNKVFDRATQAAVDLSKAGFGSLEGTSKQLGKALNDPVKGITALSRAGVTFTEQQKNQIKTYVASGDALKAQKMILKEVTSQVGGAAAAQATSGEKVRVAFDNVKESIGTALLPALEDAQNAFLKEGIPALEKFSDWFGKKGIPAIRDFAKKATPFVKGVLTDTRDILKDIAPYAKKVADAFNSLPPGIKKGLLAGALIGGAATKLPGGKPALGATSSLVKWVLPKKPILVTVTNPGGLGNGGTDKPVPVAPQSQIAKIASLAAKTVASVAIMHLGDELLKRLADSGKPKGGIDPGKVANNLKTANSLGGFGDFSIPLVGGTQIHNAVEDLKGVDALLAGMAKGGNSKAAADQFAAIAREAAKQNASLKDINAKFPKYLAAISNAKTETGKIGKAFDGPIRRARILNNEVKLIGTNARGSQAELRILLAEIRAAREAPILNAQGVSGARTGKVDNQLGRGGMYVANMNVSGTSLSEVQRDAEHKRRARANGAESFR